MIFGLKEMKEFAGSSGDPRVKALWKRLGESMSKNAKWCDRVRELEEERRWRKWPEEKPEVEQQCQLILANKLAPILCCSKYPFDHWENLNATHWRPIGPLPGGE